jgi:hypothetical protein
MANTKISALPASTTPLAGTEVLPIVQGGATKQVSVANLTAGHAVSAASVTASTGNFVVGTSGQGIDFSSTPGTGTSELLADYEEGTWTATLFDAGSGGNASATTQTGYYTKIGDTVHCFINNWNNISTAGMTAGNGLYISLPFAQNSASVSAGVIILDSVTLPVGRTSVDLYGNGGGSSRVSIVASGSAVGVADVLVSGISSGVSDILRFEFTYKV